MRARASRSGPKVRVAVRDCDDMATQLLADALARERQFEIVPCAADSILLETQADVAVIGSRIAGDSLQGCDLVKQIRAQWPETRIVVLTESLTRSSVLAAFRSGARGIFCRSESLKSLAKCIQQVHTGQVWVSSRELHYLLDALGESRPFRLMDTKGKVLLSSREHEVVRCAAEGLTNREIADTLRLSKHTVKNYLFRIFDKLGVSSRVELTLYVLNQVGANQQSTASTNSNLIEWCREAAEQGIVPAYFLAETYLDGRGVPRDKITASFWFAVAEAVSAEVREKCNAALQSMNKEMTREELTEASDRASKWLKKHEIRSPGKLPRLERPALSVSSRAKTINN